MLISNAFREHIGDISLNQQAFFSTLTTLDVNTSQILLTLNEARIAQKNELSKQSEQLSSQKSEFEKTRAAFVQGDLEMRKARVQVHLLESLRFPEMTHRYETILRSHDKTFKWVYEDPLHFEKPWDNFKSWLSESSEVYWMQGKAASGKSTLFRHIWDNQNTWNCLKDWAADSELIAGAFYFWNSGVPEQRSYTGLLRSLLYEILTKRKDLIPEVLGDEWELKSSHVAHDMQLTQITWTSGRLQAAFAHLVRLTNKDFRLCLFIDGLDEYDGSAGDIAEYISGLSKQSPFTKFCVSSRPWPVFDSFFHKSPGLKLQDLTKDDIRAYVTDLLGKNPQMQALQNEEPESTTALIEEVVEKSAGVFLWVELVVKSLISGLRDGDEISHLRDRLARLPPDLERLYEHMYSNIEPAYKQESSKMFQIFRANGYRLGIPTLYRALLYSDAQQVMELEMGSMGSTAGENAVASEQVMDEKLTRMVTRLNSRTKGLLEAHSIQDVDQGTHTLRYGSSTTRFIRRSGGRSAHGRTSPKGMGTLESGQAAWSSRSESRYDNQPTNEEQLRYSTFRTCYETPEPRLCSLFSPEKTSPEIVSHKSEHQKLYCTRSWPRRPKSRYSIQRANERPLRRLNDRTRLIHSCPSAEETRPEFEDQPQQDYPYCKNPYYMIEVTDEPSPVVLSRVSQSIRNTPAKVSQADSCWPQAPPYIIYLHRTARDYMEQRHVWQNVLDQTKDIKFDPSLALLVAYVAEAKTTPLVEMIGQCVCDAGRKLFSALALLTIRSHSYEADSLLEELDRILTAKSHFTEASREAFYHWRLCPAHVVSPKERQQRRAWETDTLSMAVACGIHWYIDAKLSDIACPIALARVQGLPLPCIGKMQRPGLPILAYALSFDAWAGGCWTSVPNLPMVQKLLTSGQNPNSIFRGYTLWQYTIHYMHTFSDIRNLEKATWLRVFYLMLEHGADPYACCIEDSRAFSQSVALQQPPFVGNHCDLNLAAHPMNPEKRPAREWIATETLHAEHHSVTAIICDVFDGPEQARLLALVEDKKKECGRYQGGKRKRKRKGKDPFATGPRWVS